MISIKNMKKLNNFWKKKY